MARFAMILLLALYLLAPAPREPTLRVVIAPHEISDALPGIPHVEPHLATSPTDTDHLVAGVIVAAPDRHEGPWHCAALVSRDGGRSWARSDLTAVGRCIDPWALVLHDGTALLATIEIRGSGEGAQRLALRVSRSPDGGESWSAPLDLGGGWEHPFLMELEGRVLLAARRAVPRDGRLRHEVTFLASTDGGRSFGPLRAIAVSNLTNTVTGLLRNGEDLVVSVLDEPRWREGVPIDSLATRRAWLLRSTDGGGSWSAPLFVTEVCGEAQGFPGWPALTRVPTASGGRLAHACVAAGSAGVALSLSEDGGESWRAPVILDGLADRPEVRTPMLTSPSAGVLVVAWYDRDADPEACRQQLVLALSVDGGDSFSAPRPISDPPSCPRAPGNGGVVDAWPMGGDYGSLAVALDGTLHALWADAGPGRFRIHHAALRIDR